MNARPRQLATTTTLVLVAAIAAACERTPTPSTSRTADAANYATTLSAPAAPSMVGTPIEATPATHAMAVAPPAPEEPTARDTAALAPGGTLTAQKENTAMPLAGQTDNHSSDSRKAGTNEGGGTNGSAAPTGTTAETVAPPTIAPSPTPAT